MRRLSRVLVTGGAGFIGSVLVRRLLASDEGVRVVTLDALTYAGSEAQLDGLDPARHTFVHGDVRDEALVARLLREHGCETVIHLAAESHVDRSIDGPAIFLASNVEGTLSMLQAARRVWLEERSIDPATARFHQVSTDEVYGDLPPDAAPVTEDAPYRPSSPYAASKAAADHLARAWHRTYGLPVTLSHGSNTYGVHQWPEKLIPVVVRAAVEGRTIPVYGDGQQVRDWLHVDDHADGILAVVRRGRDGESYNVGGAQPRTNALLVAEICAVLDAVKPDGAPHARWVRSVRDRPGHDRRYAVDSGKAWRELGWRPVVLWDGFAEVVRGMAG